jgi:hypothetical protein
MESRNWDWTFAPGGLRPEYEPSFLDCARTDSAGGGWVFGGVAKDGTRAAVLETSGDIVGAGIGILVDCAKQEKRMTHKFADN